ncbi:MAG: Cytochrome c [Acidimicrobiales bacterium]|nr:Cytochrome c [Acidimicrobiales bacterium]
MVKWTMVKWTMVKRALLTVAIVAVAIQLVPYGRGGDPAPSQEAPWPSAQARVIAVESCYDCHSRTPQRPWYAQVAPASWLVQRDIDEARAKLDFTAWDSGEQETNDAAEVVRDGAMPPSRYLLLHPGARLDAREKQVLVAALDALDGRGQGRGRGRQGGGHDAEN